MGYTILYLLHLGTNPNQPTFGTYTIIPTTSTKTLEEVQNYKGIQPYNEQGAQELNNLMSKTQLVSSQNGVITLTPEQQKALENQGKNNNGNPGGGSNPTPKQSNETNTNNGPISDQHIQSGTANNNKVNNLDIGSSSQVTTSDKNGNPSITNRTQSSIDKAAQEKVDEQKTVENTKKAADYARGHRI